jgi:hypothetical protein
MGACSETNEFELYLGSASDVGHHIISCNLLQKPSPKSHGLVTLRCDTDLTVIDRIHYKYKGHVCRITSLKQAF